MKNVIGPRVARLRRATGMTQRNLARTLGVTPATLSQWENGQRPFPAARLVRAATALGVRVEWLRVDDNPLSVREIGRRSVLRPPYPPGATVEQLADMGLHQLETVERVRDTLPGEMYRIVAEDLPRDTAHELLVALKLLACDGVVELSSPGHYRCPEHTMHDLLGSVGDHLVQPAIVLQSEGDRLVVFSQVWINVARYGPIRVDFLAACKRKGHPAYWFAIEIDDRSSHEEKRYRDHARALALALPVLRYENHVVHKTWFLPRLLRDIRDLEPEAARLRRARRYDRTRQAKAAERRQRGLEAHGQPDLSGSGDWAA